MEKGTIKLFYDEELFGKNKFSAANNTCGDTDQKADLEEQIKTLFDAHPDLTDTEKEEIATAAKRAFKNHPYPPGKYDAGYIELNRAFFNDSTAGIRAYDMRKIRKMLEIFVENDFPLDETEISNIMRNCEETYELSYPLSYSRTFALKRAIEMMVQSI